MPADGRARGPMGGQRGGTGTAGQPMGAARGRGPAARLLLMGDGGTGARTWRGRAGTVLGGGRVRAGGVRVSPLPPPQGPPWSPGGLGPGCEGAHGLGGQQGVAGAGGNKGRLCPTTPSTAPTGRESLRLGCSVGLEPSPSSQHPAVPSRRWARALLACCFFARVAPGAEARPQPGFRALGTRMCREILRCGGTARASKLCNPCWRSWGGFAEHHQTLVGRQWGGHPGLWGAPEGLPTHRDFSVPCPF